MEERRTVLFPVHVAAGARLADFGGWRMPMEYATGVIAEHTAVRTGVGVFDVSHMGVLQVSGPGALGGLNAILANDLTRIGPGQAQYSFLLNESGGVVDDLICYLEAPDSLLIVANATNTATVLKSLREALAGSAAHVEQRSDHGILAVQGPGSADLLTSLNVLPEPLAYMHFMSAALPGGEALICRTGYTGELGFELIAPNGLIAALWDRVAQRAVPCGLGARDTLRTEMGYPLHGQDLSPAISPVEAGLSWAVGWDKPAFAGRQALLAQRANGPARRLRGLVLTGRGVPRPRMQVLAPAGTVLGETTSGTFSPTRKVGVALALLDAGVAVGDGVLLDIRGRSIPAEIVKPPFVERSPR